MRSEQLPSEKTLKKDISLPKHLSDSDLSYGPLAE